PDYLSYTKISNCYHILKKYDQAAADYEKAIRIKKDFIPAYNNAIEIYILTDNFFQALTLLERLSQIEKSYSHKAVELYLRLIAQKGLMQNTEKTEKELDALLRENFTFNFSVKEIEDWLMTADIDATDKKMIRVKTELLKMKREYATFA
ncbi:MAG: tetratricopeptide repeat protein, partial [Raineya sp.]